MTDIRNSHFDRFPAATFDLPQKAQPTSEERVFAAFFHQRPVRRLRIAWKSLINKGFRTISRGSFELGSALRPQAAAAKAANLKAWLAGLVATYDDKIIPIDTNVAALAGQLEAKANFQGHDPGMADATIAAIAKAHDLVIMTHNTKHFRVFGVEGVSPDDTAHFSRTKRAAR